MGRRASNPGRWAASPGATGAVPTAAEELQASKDALAVAEDPFRQEVMLKSYDGAEGLERLSFRSGEVCPPVAT